MHMYIYKYFFTESWVNASVNSYNETGYFKSPKNLNILFHTFFSLILLFIQLFIKIFSGKANNVDPDQTAP